MESRRPGRPDDLGKTAPGLNVGSSRNKLFHRSADREKEKFLKGRVVYPQGGNFRTEGNEETGGEMNGKADPRRAVTNEVTGL